LATGRAAARTKLHFSRFEFKYVLPRTLREEVESELLNFLELDPWVAARPGHEYLVRSLYFDDPAFTAYFDKTDGLHTRSKFRVRTYTDDPGQGVPRFLEVKGRFNNLVFKHRVPLRGAGGRAGGNGSFSDLVLSSAEPGAVRNQFEFQLYRRRIRPRVLVDYVRRPYLSRYDPEFRLTFDSELRATAADTLFPEDPAPRRMLPGYTVLEVKFRYHVPAWFHRVVQAYELRRRSISKVCAGTEILGLACDPA
jgi:hypothetical protein